MKKFISIFLACMLALCLFAACGSETEDNTGGEDYSPDSEVVNSETDLDLSVEDICYAESGIPGDTVLFTVDGYDVTADLFFYVLGSNISYDSYYYGEEPDFINNGEEIISEAVQTASQFILTKEKAEEMGCELSEEDLNDFYDSIEEMKEAYGGEEIFQEALKSSCLTEDVYINASLCSMYIELIEQEAFEGHPDSEELREYADDNDLLCVKQILILTVDDNYEPLSDEEKAEKLAEAEDILEQIRNSDDPESTFEELREEYSEDGGVSSYPDGLLFAYGDMVEPVEDAIQDLDYGEISDIIEYDDYDEGGYTGYHIVMRLDPVDYPDIAEYWTEDATYDIIQGWVDDADYEYTDEFNEINGELIESFYEKYLEYQTAFSDDIEQKQEEAVETE